ncbi:hypothetical protein [Alloacidobacterium sp.]|uniref:hypothetical protein n=1 Tax=Alloacidobacterium sp. TaxID=2951999 RepID=UPI002D6766A1|nr:hypothetical protein [Alloacidobacterium sp.]HYK37973.1 hypothetical protein [Alloacidobacterium sp.]
MQLVAILAAAGLVMAGCHKPITQQTPSLSVPGPVEHLAVVRGDNMIWLTWTMPHKTTDGHKIKTDITIQVCRREDISGTCTNAGDSFLLAPSATGSFSEMLPPELTSGPARALYYFVELRNSNGRSTGLTNSVWTVAGNGPSPIVEFTAVTHENGVLLRWKPSSSGDNPSDTVIRVYRRLLTSTRVAQAQLAEQKLLIELPGTFDHAVDNEVHVGSIYEYRVQCVGRVTVNKQTLESPGRFSLPIRIQVGSAGPSSAGLDKSD